MKPSRIVLGCVLASFAFMAGGAGAQVVTEFSAGAGGGAADPFAITAGPDGNLWYTEAAANRIGRITPAGVVAEFSAGISALADLRSITAGPDGNLWFTEYDHISGNRIGRITPLGVVTEFSAGIGAGASPYDITAGPDGNLWFTELRANRIGRITPAGVVTEFKTGIDDGGTLGITVGITAGPDGNLWFTHRGGGFGSPYVNVIGQITPLGVVTLFKAPFPVDITAGPDGNLWFTEEGIDLIGRITPLGVVTEFSAGSPPGYYPGSITAGPDGNLWFTELNSIGRITPDGVVTHFSAGIDVSANIAGITTGPDGNLWFTEPSVWRIGRITTGAVGAPPYLIGAVSRKMHGGAGVFDLALSIVATDPTTEPRLGPVHTLAVSFDKPLIGATATVTEGIGTASVSTLIANNVVVSLTGVTDQQYVTVSLTNVTSSDGGTGGGGSVRIGFLAGDVNQNRVVSVADLGLVKAQLAQPVTMANYLKDVNASGTLTVADSGLTNANLTKALPAP